MSAQSNTTRPAEARKHVSEEHLSDVDSGHFRQSLSEADDGVRTITYLLREICIVHSIFQHACICRNTHLHGALLFPGRVLASLIPSDLETGALVRGCHIRAMLIG